MVYKLFDTCLSIWPKSHAKNGVALIRLDSIGDFVLWLDSAKEYRRLYEGQRIVLIANTSWADWAGSFPHWDEVWSVDSRRLSNNLIYRIKMLFKVRRAGFKTVIQPTFSRTLQADNLVRASAAPQRIGSEGDESNLTATLKSVSNNWYTQLISASDKSLMELERNAEFIRNLSGQVYEPAIPRLPKACIKTDFRPLSGNYIVFFPGASWHGRQWPLKNFAELASRLHTELGWPFVLCGGYGDIELVEQLGVALTVPFVNLAGKTSLAELAGVICNSRMLISNETSAVHIAAAVGTPTVCVLGGGHHGRFVPYPSDLPGIKPLVAAHPMPCFNCNWKCSQQYEETDSVPCIQKIDIHRILSLAIRITKN